MKRQFYILLFLVNVFCAWPQMTLPKIKLKTSFKDEEGVKLLTQQELYNQNNQLLVESKYGYSGKNLYSTDRKYYYYGKNMDSVVVYAILKKDSTQVLRQLIHKQKGRKTKTEFFEKQNEKLLYSYTTYKYIKKGADSTLYERYKLYNGDSVLHTYKFKDKEIISHIVIKNNKLQKSVYYYYNEKGLLVKKTSVDNIWNSNSTEVFEYENNTKSKSLVETVYSGGRRSVSVYTYDDKGNELTVEYNNYNGRFKDGMAFSFTESEYIYEKGLIKEIKSSSKNFSQRIFKEDIIYEYEFYQ